MDEEYTDSVFGNNVQDTAINYSSLGLQYKYTTPIPETASRLNNSPIYNASMFDEFTLAEYIPTIFERKKTKVERKDPLMDPVQTSISVIGGTLDDHPYRPTLRTDSFGVLTENQKETRKELTNQLYKDTKNNI